MPERDLMIIKNVAKPSSDPRLLPSALVPRVRSRPGTEAERALYKEGGCAHVPTVPGKRVRITPQTKIKIKTKNRTNE